MFPENFSNILWFSLCILGLLLAGVFLSGISRKQIGIFESNTAMVKVTKEREGIANALRHEIQILGERLEAKSERANSSASRLANERAAQLSLRANIQDIEEKASSLGEDIPKLTSEFAAFRKDNLAAVWSKAAGERIGSLYLKNGRMLEGVVIRQVRDDGLEILHSNGMSKIAAKDLPNSYQARFQWEPE